MLKREPVIRELIQNGYNDELATQLPKLYIEDFFDKEYEKLSEALDIFIDSVQRGDRLPLDDNIIFGTVRQMKEKDMDRHSFGLFYNFRVNIREGFTNIVRRQPLQDILLEGGAMKLHPEFADISKNPVYYEKEIVGSPEEYRDLCFVCPVYIGSSNSSYIRLNDLYSLLQSKGLNEDSIIFDGAIYIRYNDIINIGKRNIISNPNMLQRTQ